jgi:raffinose/stachyose/melibiose transport system substrate-binding protein
MIADGTWDATTIQAANPDLKFGYFPIPGSNDAAKNKDLAGKYDMTWMVVDKSPNKDYALKWLEMLSEKGNYTDFVNAAGFLPTQPDVEIKSEFIKDIQPYLENFKLSWDQLFINRQNVGQYIAESSVHAEMLKPAGPIATPEELASKSQADWDAAAPK